MSSMSLEQTIGEALARDPGLIATYLFGSHADGRVHRESDVDVAVLLDRRSYESPRARFAARLRLIGELGHALGRSDIDLVILNDAPPPLARAILTSGRLVFCRDDETTHAFLRTVLLRAADLEPFLRRARAVKLEALRR
jgi:predicted nucleotidyltransferase